MADGKALFESAAICEFLDETHPPRLSPADPFERARQRAWVEVGVDFLAGTPQLAALARSLANRPSVAEMVPGDFGDQFIQILAELGSVLVPGAGSARAASTG